MLGCVARFAGFDCGQLNSTVQEHNDGVMENGTSDSQLFAVRALVRPSTGLCTEVPVFHATPIHLLPYLLHALSSAHLDSINLLFALGFIENMECSAHLPLNIDIPPVHCN